MADAFNLDFDSELEELERQGIKTVFFDVDHTLVSINTGRAFSLFLLKGGFLKLKDLIFLPWHSILYKLGLLNYRKILESALTSWKSQTVSTLEEQGKKCYEQEIRPYLYESGLEWIKTLQAKNFRVILISASPKELLQFMQKDLRVELIATELEKDGNYFTGKVAGDPCYGQGKVEEIYRLYGGREKVPNFSAYSDSISDLPLFKLSTLPVVIHPDFRLKKVALKNKWKIFYW